MSEMTTVPVKLPVPMRDELAAIAKEEDRSIASLVRLACREYLANRVTGDFRPHPIPVTSPKEGEDGS